MITDVMAVLLGKNLPLFEAEVDCFLTITGTLLHLLILKWGCEASRTILYSTVILTCIHYLLQHVDFRRGNTSMQVERIEVWPAPCSKRSANPDYEA